MRGSRKPKHLAPRKRDEELAAIADEAERRDAEIMSRLTDLATMSADDAAKLPQHELQMREDARQSAANAPVYLKFISDRYRDARKRGKEGASAAPHATVIVLPAPAERAPDASVKVIEVKPRND